MDEEGWQHAGRVGEISSARPLAVEVGGREVLLCRSGGDVFAVDARCPHAGQSLAQGRVRGGAIACPFHGARFRLSDGAPTAGPTRRALGTHRVRIADGEVWVRL
ncbi:Rieske (2Fe-2S) protein [Erythrobacter sp.]|jgi:3-phenylpropionate/trans-cinnamate dioxygenase ferredoxin subunit|uniref:Rieske (2Fe-2S) protein n=1 Tax=Erythrobacter sp. TaxID=1042 RepID=UPI002EB1F4CC|nr:non-heme iron oxygenase ferredoxin subunit [Erythrobacter sp.]